METKNASLLLKFTSFLRDIGNNDDDDSGDSGFEAAPGTLRDRLQRQRHQDNVRSHEFKQLRTLIEQRQPAGTSRAPATPAKPATTRPTSRSGTSPPANPPNAALQQWWGGGDPAPQDKPVSAPSAPATAPVTARRATGSAPSSAPINDELDLDFTALGTSTAPEATPADSTAAFAPFDPFDPFDGAATDSTPEPDSGIDQSLRNAAVNYAQGNFTAAEKEMLTVLGDHTLDPASIEMLTFALFDIYRATGQKERFEAAALNYAERHGRSPAEWFSIPEQLEAHQKTNPAAAHQPPSAAGTSTLWRCPQRLDTTGLVQLQTFAATPDNSCPIDWSDLKSIDTNTGTALATLVRHWCNSPQQLRWTGVNALLQALELHTRQASARGDPLWWTIHMDMLCILRQPDAFETLALDYCVAFEVSPPAWIDVACKLQQDQPSSGSAALATTIVESRHSEDTPLTRAQGRFVLSGDLCGTDASGLQALQSQTAAATLITVACGLLRRIDEKAAQTLLYWAKQAADRGSTIQFVQVPRLVLVFMLILGLDQYADLSTRIN